MAPKAKQSITAQTIQATGEPMRLQFESQEQMDAFIQQIEAANNGSTDTIILPDGTQLRQLTNGEKWLLINLIGVYLFLLLFSVIR